MYVPRSLPSLSSLWAWSLFPHTVLHFMRNNISKWRNTVRFRKAVYVSQPNSIPVKIFNTNAHNTWKSLTRVCMLSSPHSDTYREMFCQTKPFNTDVIIFWLFSIFQTSSSAESIYENVNELAPEADRQTNIQTDGEGGGHCVHVYQQIVQPSFWYFASVHRITTKLAFIHPRQIMGTLSDLLPSFWYVNQHRSL